MGHRETLGLNQNAGNREIKKAFREAAKEFHPDHNDSPEAAEAFKRIREAHDALIQDADAPRESTSATISSAQAAAATVKTAYAHHQSQQVSDEELKHTQELDKIAQQTASRKGILTRAKESAELRRHRKKIKTNTDRITGKY